MVRQGIHKPSNRKVAIKSYEKSKLYSASRKSGVQNEIHYLKKISHENIVSFHDSVETAKHIHIITEFIPGHSLLNYIKRKPRRCLEEDEAKVVFKQIL